MMGKSTTKKEHLVLRPSDGYVNALSASGHDQVRQHLRPHLLLDQKQINVIGSQRLEQGALLHEAFEAHIINIVRRAHIREMCGDVDVDVDEMAKSAIAQCRWMKQRLPVYVRVNDPLNANSVSRMHMAIAASHPVSNKTLVHGQRVAWIMDLGSTNGVFINGNKIQTYEWVSFPVGAHIRFTPRVSGVSAPFIEFQLADIAAANTTKMSRKRNRGGSLEEKHDVSKRLARESTSDGHPVVEAASNDGADSIVEPVQTPEQSLFLSEHTCCICSELMDDVACLDCRVHRFCHTCLDKAMIVQTKPSCPLCRHPQPSGMAIRLPEATAEIEAWLSSNPGLVDPIQRAQTRVESRAQLQQMRDHKKGIDDETVHLFRSLLGRLDYLQRRRAMFSRLTTEGVWNMERAGTFDHVCRCCCYPITAGEWRLCCRATPPAASSSAAVGSSEHTPTTSTEPAQVVVSHRETVYVHLSCVHELGNADVIARLRSNVRTPHFSDAERVEVYMLLEASARQRAYAQPQSSVDALNLPQ